MRITTRGTLIWDEELQQYVAVPEEGYEYSGPLSLAGGGGDPGPQTTTQTTEPWEGQKPFLTEIFKQAQQQFEAPGPQYFPGSTVAPLAPETLQAQDVVRDYATGAAPQIAQQAQGALQFGLGPVLFPESNPALEAATQAAIRPVVQTFQEQVLPGIRGGAIGAGQLGSSRQGIAEGIALDRLGQSLLETTSKIQSEGYGQGLDAFVKSLALAPQTQQLGLAPAQALDVVGQQQRGFGQSLIEEQIARHNFEQTIEAQKLAQYQNFIQGQFGGTSTATGPGATSSPFGGVGGALAGAQLGAQFGPQGAAIGGGLGLLLGLL